MHRPAPAGMLAGYWQCNDRDVMDGGSPDDPLINGCVAMVGWARKTNKGLEFEVRAPGAAEAPLPWSDRSYGTTKVKSLVFVSQHFSNSTTVAMLPTSVCTYPVFSRARPWLPCKRAVPGWAGMCAEFSSGDPAHQLGWSVLGGLAAPQL